MVDKTQLDIALLNIVSDKYTIFHLNNKNKKPLNIFMVFQNKNCVAWASPKAMLLLARLILKCEEFILSDSIND